MVSRPHPARHAFTLIELLVVVTILAILAALLLPAIGLARQAAHKADCLSRLRQIGMGIHAYADESDGLLPHCRIREIHAETVWPGEGQVDWYDGIMVGQFIEDAASADGRLRGDEGARTFYRCPADHRPANQWGGFESSYALNMYLGNEVWNDRFATDSWGSQTRALTQIPRSSEMVLVTDGRLGMIGMWGWGDPITPIVEDEEVLDWVGHERVMIRRHGGAVNLLFVDGHARTSPDPVAEGLTDRIFFHPELW